MERKESSFQDGDRVKAQEVLSPSIARGALRLVIETSQPEVFFGTPLDAIPDMSVGETEEQVLRRSRWAGIVEVRFQDSGLTRHQALLDLVEDRLTGRTPMTRMSESLLLADFQVSDDSHETRQAVAAFASALGRVLGNSVVSTDGRIVKFETSKVDHLLGEEFRPRPYAI